jgi:hypothetical protein
VIRATVRSRVVTTLHLALVGPLFVAWAIAIFGRGSVTGALPLAIWAAELTALWLVMCWCTDRALLGFDVTAPRVDELITAGVRWGAATGVLLLWGNALALLLIGTIGVVVGPQPDEYALAGEEWAYLWICAVVATVGALLAGLIGAGLGGVTGIIDHAVLTVANWSFRRPRSQ